MIRTNWKDCSLKLLLLTPFFLALPFQHVEAYPLEITSSSKPLFSEEELEDIQQEKEALHVRRILQLWQESETSLTVRQIHSFTSQYPDSLFRQKLQILLGEIFLQKGSFQEAYHAFSEVTEGELLAPAIQKQIECSLCLKNFNPLIQKLRKIQQNPKLKSKEREVIAIALLEVQLEQASGQQNQHKRQSALLTITQELDRLSKIYSGERILFLQAKAEELMGENEKAVATLQKIKPQSPKQEARLLITIAKLQSSFAAAEAKENLGKALSRVDPLTAEMGLCIAKEYLRVQAPEEALKIKSMIATTPNNSLLGELAFIEAQAFFALQDFSRCQETLLALIEEVSSPISRVSEEHLYLLLVTSSFKIRDYEKIEQWVSLLREKYPNSDYTAQSALVLAYTQKALGDTSSAEKTLNSLLESPSAHIAKTRIEYEIALINLMESKWSEARKRFLSLFESECQPATLELAAEKAYYTALHEKKTQESPHLVVVDTLEVLMTQTAKLSKESIERYTLSLAKEYFALEKFQECISLAKNLTTTSSNTSRIGEAAYTLCLCLQKQSRNGSELIQFGELALQNSLSDDHISNIKLILGHAHLSRSESYTEASLKKQELDKGVLYLVDVILNTEKKIAPSTILWVADYTFGQYFDEKRSILLSPRKSQTSEKEVAKTLDLYRHLIPENTPLSSLNAPKISPLNLYHASFRLAKVLLEGKKYEEATSLLTALEHTPLPKGTKPSMLAKILFLKGLAQKHLQRDTEALNSFEKGYASAQVNFTAVKGACLLEKSKLEFKFLAAEERHLKNEKVQNILKSLNGLKTRKNLSSEPLHLEAAIEHATIRGCLEKERPVPESMLDLLSSLKESFLSEDDIWSKDYTASRQRFPQLESLFQDYMTFVDAKIAYWMGKKALEDHNPFMAHSHFQVSKDLYSRLSLSPHSLTQSSQSVLHQEIQETKRSLAVASVEKTRSPEQVE